MEDREGTLYRYDIKKDESDRISGQASTLGCSADGASILYFEDVESTGYSGVMIGTLKLAAAGKDTVRISSDVLTSSLDSGHESAYMVGSVDVSGFYFEKYVSETEETESGRYTLVNWMYWNGKTAETAARDVLHSIDRTTDVQRRGQD